MARRYAVNMPVKDMMFMAPEKPRKPTAIPTSSFVGSMLVKATIPIALPTKNQVESEDMERYTLLVIGDNNCGKTCLLKSFAKSDFEVDDSDCGIFEDCIAKVEIGSRAVEFMLSDLSGHEDYDGLRIELFQIADIYLVCFDIGNPASLESVEDVWIPEIRYVTPDTPFILVGCKNDLRTDATLDYFLSVPGAVNDNDNSNDSVGKSKAEKSAADFGAKEYIECCSKTKFNINEVFKMAAHVLLCKNDPSYSLQSKSSNGFLSKYGRRRSTEVGTDKQQLKRGKLLFSPERNIRKGSLF